MEDMNRKQQYISIYGTLQDCVESNFIASAHDKSDHMYANNVWQLVTHQSDDQGSKPEEILFNAGSCYRPLSIWAVCVWLGV